MRVPNRKDTAASHTRKIIFDSTPLTGLSTAFRKVDEMVITAQCLVKAMAVGKPELNMQLLKLYICLLGNKAVKSTPLHLVIHFAGMNDMRLGYLFDDILTLVPLTVELLDMRITSATITDLFIAFRIGAIIKFSCPGLLDHDELARDAANLLDNWLCVGACVCVEACSRYLGQIYLCDIPQLIFPPEEFAEAIAAGTANRDARLQLWELIASRDRAAVEEGLWKWNLLSSRVHLVESGLRPQLAEAAATLKRR